MGKRSHIAIPKKEIEDFCKENHIRKLSLFGSVLRDDFREDSDVDVLIEFEPGQAIGYFRMAGMEIELSELFGCKVDLRTPQELSRYFRQEVLESAEILYAKE